MRVTLLGTGSADGWPNPFCTCRSCAWARTDGVIRARSCALIGDSVLIDPGPDVTTSIARAGRTLAGMHTVLVTHGHFDHLAPELLLARHWSAASTPLTIAGPEGALDLVRPWIAPDDDSVTFVALTAGASLELVDGIVVRAHAANHSALNGPAASDALSAEALVFEIEQGTERLLYALDTGVLPAATVEAMSGRRCDIVIIDEAFGIKHDHGTGHHDLATLPLTLDAFRRADVIDTDTRVIVSGLSHHNPPEPELRGILTPMGAEVVRDLTVIDTAVGRRGQRTLVTGGARSGKSHIAESLATRHESVIYIATADRRDDDTEWQERIALHAQRRPAHWKVEETRDIGSVLSERSAHECVLIDCLTLWLSGVMDDHDAWQTGDLSAVTHRIDQFLEALASTSATVVLVTNEVGSGIVPDTASGRLFRDLLGRLNARVGDVCDEVLMAVAGRTARLQEPAR
jgi:adenosylcobinamide kinase / adenosylcobinamide-phosphate guanylyltransferase